MARHRSLRRTISAPLAVLTVAFMFLTACGSDDDASVGAGQEGAGDVEAVLSVKAAFYPLAFVSERVGGDLADVSTITPPGADAHDVELTPRDVASLEDADLVVFLSGFQASVDAAIESTGAEAFDVADAADLSLTFDGEHSHDHDGEDDHAHDDDDDHAHGEDDHAHGEDDHAHDEDDDHAHGEDDHAHGEDDHAHGEDDHAHDDDDDHAHDDDDHAHDDDDHAHDDDDHAHDDDDDHAHDDDDDHAHDDDDHGHDHGPGSTDPHFWLDPVRLAAVGAEVAERFAELDPDNAETYRANAESLGDDLADLDAELEAGLADCENTLIVTNHESFGYLADRYGLDQVGISGLSPSEAPSPRAQAEIADFVADEGVRTIYYETTVSPDVAQTVADEAGADIALLDPLESLTDDSEGTDYLEVMRSNLSNLQEGQPCR